MGTKKLSEETPTVGTGLSLSALLSAEAPIDEELDVIFKHSMQIGASKVIEPSTLASAKSSKRKGYSEPTVEREGKRKKSLGTATERLDPSSQKVSPAASITREVVVVPRKLEGSSDEDQSDLENAYIARHNAKLSPTKPSSTKSKAGKSPTEEGSSDSSVEGDGGHPRPSTSLVHESLLAKSSSTSTSKASSQKRFVPEGETREQRDARTIFVGNLPVEAAKTKSALKGLTRLILSSVPGAKIESTRFRSVAFKNPTAELPKSDDEAETPNNNKNKVGSQKKEVRPPRSTGLSAKQLRQQGRAAEWRSQEDEAAEKPGSGKVYLDPAEKKRIAFIKGEFHEGADAIHAYVVFAHPAPNRSPNVPPIFDPYKAAKLAVKKCDGVVYMDRTLRVDHVGSAAAGVSKRGGTGHLDTRRTVFVGNLDFQSKEEDIRAFFEALLTTERGPPGEDDEGEEKSEGESFADPVASTKAWVVHVRLVRDQDTQLGKGFAYVEFADRTCVDEVLAMEQGKIRFAKRKLRVERCKVKPGSKSSRQASTTGPATTPILPKSTAAPAGPRKVSFAKPKAGATAISIPKGDPSLGERLKGLDKEARRTAKSSDADRVARRLAKKQARSALERQGVSESGKFKKGGILGNPKRVGGPKPKAKPSRIRSDKSVSKRNNKK